MKISVRQTWLDHSSGTKFYHVIQLSPEKGEGSAVTITHWGKQSIVRSTFQRPILGGETQITNGAVGTTKISAKQKRGYQQHDTLIKTVDDSRWMIDQFGAEKAHEIELAMFGAKGDPSDAPETKAIPKAKAKAKAIEPEAPRPEAWGTW
jgi:hypothetical protein